MTFNIYIHILQGRISAVLRARKRLDGKPGAAFVRIWWKCFIFDVGQGERLKMHFTESFGLFRRHKKPSWIFKDWVTDWVPWSVFMGSLCWIVSDSWSEFVHSCLCPAAAAWAFTESRINPLGLSGRTWVSQFNVLRLGHLGERLLHPQGGQTRGRIVSPTLGHQFTHLPQTLDKHTQRQD